jgi:hypothetical protein
MSSATIALALAISSTVTPSCVTLICCAARSVLATSAALLVVLLGALKYLFDLVEKYRHPNG